MTKNRTSDLQKRYGENLRKQNPKLLSRSKSHSDDELGFFSDYERKKELIDDFKEGIIEIARRNNKLPKSHPNNIDEYHFKGVISIDNIKQHIKIGEYTFPNFDSLFTKFKIKNKDTKVKWKGGIGTIWALVKCSNIRKIQDNFDCLDLKDYYKEFKSQRTNWIFENCGNPKKKISSTDCATIGSILGHCGLNIRVGLTDDEKKVIIKKM